jgi:hypothetical protein
MLKNQKINIRLQVECSDMQVRSSVIILAEINSKNL